MLAQETLALFLDEPTTFLDLAAQVDLLDMVWRLNRDDGRTVVMVLHNLNLAARYADHLIAMTDGRIVASGGPEQVITDSLLRDVFDIEAGVIEDQRTGRPLVLPRAASQIIRARECRIARCPLNRNTRSADRHTSRGSSHIREWLTSLCRNLGDSFTARDAGRCDAPRRRLPGSVR